MLDKNFLLLLEELTDQERRRQASLKLAQLLGARDLIFFVRDPEIDLFIPAPGYSQVMKSPESWQKFLRDCVLLSRSRALVSWPDKNISEKEHSLVYGISSNMRDREDLKEEESVLVFLEEPISGEMLGQVIKLLPILAACIRSEWVARSADSTVSFHQNKVRRSEKIISQLENSRAEMQRSLYHAQKALSSRNDFLSVASHELKTPLQSVILETGLLRRGIESLEESPLKGRTKKRLDALEVHLKRMSTLVDNLLDYSQVDGKSVYNFQRVNLSTLARSVVQRFQGQARDAGIRIHLEYSDVIVNCDISKMDQVISNLISNAIKYGDNKDVYVSISESGGVPEFKIRDQGIGINANEIGRIFERFERSKSAAKISGFGLGLFVVKQILEGHGGVINVLSIPGEGSTFVFNLKPELYERKYERLQ